MLGHPGHVSADAGRTHVDRLTVPSLPASIASVRRFALGVCRTHQASDEACDAVALLVSEVATNALVHGTGNVQVQVSAAGGVLRVEVTDDSPELPRPRAAGLLEEGGRGLALVASMAKNWGVRREGGGKVVWFEVA